MALKRYRRGTPPAFPESQPQYLQDELRKLEEVTDQAAEVSAGFTDGLNAANASILTLENVVADGTQALAQRITTLSADFNTGLTDATAKITQEATARSDSVSAVAKLVNALSASFTTQLDHTNATILQESMARADAQEALATQNNVLSVTFNSSISAAVSTESTARATADTALGQRIDTVTATANGNSAAITTETNARVQGDQANASQITTLTSTVNGYSSQIQTIQNTVNGVSASYGVRINNNNHISGFGLNSGQGGTSNFYIEADTFAIATPGSTSDYKVYWDGSKMVIHGDVYADNFYGNVINTGNIVPSAVTTNTIAPGNITSFSSAQTTTGSLSISVTTSGGPVLCIGTAAISGLDGGSQVFASIGRDTSDIADQSSNGMSEMTLLGLDYPPAGTHTYTMVGSSPSVSSSNTGTLKLVVMEGKR